MIKFLKYIVILFSTLIVLMYILDELYTYTYKNGTPRNKISYLLSLEGRNIPYVFIGSSRVDNTIDSSIIEKFTHKKALNLGVQGSNTDDYLLLLKLLKKQNIKTEFVFIQIDYVYNTQENSEILKGYLMPFIEDKTIATFLKERSPDYFRLKNLPFYRYLKFDYLIGFREFLSTTIEKRNRVNLENGYFPKYGYSGAELKAKLPSNLIERNRNIEAMNDYAKKYNINLIYFIAPYCPETENMNFADKLEKRLPRFYNFVSIFKDSPEFFFDCGHLNDSGAKEFSKIFTDTINATSKNKNFNSH